MITATRIIGFDAGHRVWKHEGKCANAHGHRYEAHVTVKASSGLDLLGRVVDFSVVKRLVGGWIDERWDHAFIVNTEDPLGAALVAAAQKVYPIMGNPTAENLALHILTVVCPFALKGTGVKAIHVRLYETPNCYADASLGDRQ